MNSKNETRTTTLFQELDEISKGQKSYTTFLNHQKMNRTIFLLRIISMITFFSTRISPLLLLSRILI